MKKSISWRFRFPFYIGLYLLFWFMIWTTVGEKILLRIMKMDYPYHTRVNLYFGSYSVGITLVYIVGELMCRRLASAFGGEENDTQGPFILLTHLFLYVAYYLELSDSINLIGQVMLFDNNDIYQACYKHYLAYVILGLGVVIGLTCWQLSREKKEKQMFILKESLPRVAWHTTLSAVLVFLWPSFVFGEKSKLFATTLSTGRLRAQYICFAFAFLVIYFLGEWIYRKTDDKNHLRESLYPSAWALVLYLILYYVGLWRITKLVDERFLTYELDSGSAYHVDNPLLRDGRLAWLIFVYGSVIIIFLLTIYFMPHGNPDKIGNRDSQQNKNTLFCFPMMEFMEAGKKEAVAASELNHAAIVDVTGNKIPEAVKKLKACIEVYPNCFAAQYNLGVLYGLQRNYAQAEDCFLKANTLSFHNSSVMRGLALSKFMLADYAACLEICKEYGNLFADEKLFKLQECCEVNLGRPAADKNIIKEEVDEDLVRAVIMNSYNKAIYGEKANLNYAQEMKKNTQKRDILFRGQRVSDSDYGYEPTNPIMTSTIDESEGYLGKLRTFDGSGFTWERVGSYCMREISGIENVMVDIYQLYLQGEKYKRIYICPYGHTSSFAPRGLHLAE